MNRLLYRGSLAYALLNALWRHLDGRTKPLRVDGGIVTWAYGDGKRDDTANLQRALDHARGGTLRIPRGSFRVCMSVQVPPVELAYATRYASAVRMRGAA